MAYETTNADGVGPNAQVVVGLFNSANDAHQAVTQLRAYGFSSGQIGAAFRSQSTGRDAERSGTGTAAVKHEAENWWEKVKDAFRSDDNIETRGDVASGSTVNTGPYAQEDYEYDFTDTDFEGSLSGAGIAADRAAYLTRNLRPGGAIVTVRDTDRVALAEQVLSSNHGKVRYEDVTGSDVAASDVAAASYRGLDPTGTNYKDMDTARADEAEIDAATSTGREISDTGYADRRPTDSENAAGDRLQLFGEVLRVHKDRISRGEVRVRKDVVTENQTIEVPVTREELVLERVSVPANTPASSANIGRSQEIRVPLIEEKVRLEKQPVVREEVIVGKREVADVARVGDDVRHEELRVDSDVDTPKRSATGEDLPDDVRRRG
jgi:uncharacterized protein (TIGR02271 family)